MAKTLSLELKMRKKDIKYPCVCITLEPELFEELETQRGKVPRSHFISEALKEFLR